MSDAEWAVVRPLLPVPGWLRGRGGQPEAYCHRAMLDAIRYLVDNGTKWRAMPADFPPWDRVYAFFRRWRNHDLVREFHDRLRRLVRERAGRDSEPGAGVIDSQSVKADAVVGSDSRGFDGGKLINGRKRHVVVDTLGLLLAVMVTAADMGDRAAAQVLLTQVTAAHHLLALVWADGGYTGSLVEYCLAALALVLAIVKRSDDMRGFVVRPKRWIVERFFAHLMRSRRLVRDFERSIAEHGRGSAIEGREYYEAFYFHTNRWRMAWQRGIALMVMAGPLVGVLVALGVMGWKGPSGAWLDVMGVAWPVLIALAVLTPLAMQHVPGTYELTVSDEGLLLLVGTDRTMLRWDEVHSVTAVRLVRRCGSPHWLLVRPRGGFVPPRRGAWQPHMDRQGNHLIFCDLRRLREPSAFVAMATAAHAGALWDDSYGMRDETSVSFGRNAESRFRFLLALCGGGCVYVSRDAGSWLLTAFTALPFLLTLAFTVAPVGLYIDDWGLRLRFLHRVVRRPWQDIDDIRLVWDESHEVFYLQVRTSSTARGWPLPYDPATGAFRMDLNLIDFTVPEFSAAFRRFAGPCWQGEKAESDLAHAGPDAEACYSGRFAGPATALTAWVLPAVLFAIGMWGAMAWTWEIDAMLPWCVATGCTPLLALLLRPKLELKLGRDGFTLSAGRRRTHVAWQDVSRVTVVRPGRAPESVASLVVWFRDGAPVPSRWRWGKCFEPWSGGVRIIRCRAAGLTSVMVTPAQLDRSLQHFAGAAWQPHTPQAT
ncbi:IS5 family transposase [Streptomyces sp. NBC_01278]|uniref:IS5 family transposase n=3 Tax=Streptomyces TaxID=1883 RepID=UPI002E371214|nr:IS5 family transposase [Streptomyces sp. NBC_01278]